MSLHSKFAFILFISLFFQVQPNLDYPDLDYPHFFSGLNNYLAMNIY